MIFYLCNGNQLAGTQADARALDRDFIQIDVPTDKAGLMAYINGLMAAGPPEQEQPPAPPPAPAPVREPSYTEVSIKIEEVFENLPLAMQLHFAAVAMENARKRLPD